MVVLGVDPAGAGKTSAQRCKRLGNVGGNFKTGEDAGHGDSVDTNRSLQTEVDHVAAIRATLLAGRSHTDVTL
jgi:hypothetical protein